MDDLIIKIKNNSSEARVVFTNSDGFQTNKNVCIDDLLDALNSNNKISTGVLPSNTKFFSGTRGDYIIGIESPRRVRRFIQFDNNHNVDKEFRIPFPICLFIFYVSDGLIKSSKLFALNEKLNNKKDTLYRFPFGNTYEDGRICWGNNKIPKIKKPQSLHSLIAMFYDAPFNGDLFDSKTIKMERSNFWTFVKSLDGKDFFPNKVLFEVNVNLENIMRNQ